MHCFVTRHLRFTYRLIDRSPFSFFVFFLFLFVYRHFLLSAPSQSYAFLSQYASVIRLIYDYCRKEREFSSSVPAVSYVITALAAFFRINVFRAVCRLCCLHRFMTSVRIIAYLNNLINIIS